MALVLAVSTAPAHLLSQPVPRQQLSSAAARNSAISGVVSDGATSRPIAGVAISVSGAGATSKTVTDSKGRFVFRNLPACDKCFLHASKPGYEAGGVTRIDMRAFMSTAIGLAENEWISDLNVIMWKPGGISGTVVDEHGAPVVDVPVRVLISVPIAGTFHFAGGPATRTDDRGRYRIAGLVAGTYVVNVPSVQSSVAPDTPQATIQGVRNISVLPQALASVPVLDAGSSWLVLGQYATPPSGARETYPALYYPNVRAISEATPINLGHSEERRGVDFVIRPVASVRVSGRLDGPPEAVAGVVVRLLQEGADALAPASEQATALTGPDGSFVMPNVAAGSYVLDVRTSISEITAGATSALPSTPGLVGDSSFSFVSSITGFELSGGIRHRRLPGRDGWSARRPIVVGGDDLSGVVLPLERGVTISGHVVSDDGAVVSAASVTLEPASGDPGLMYWQGIRDPNRKSGASFELQGVLPGQYFFRGGLVKSVTANGRDVTNQPLHVTAGTDVSNVMITLTAQPARIDGTVTKADGSTAREAAVIIFPTDPAQWTNFGVHPPRIQSITFFGSGKYQIPRVTAGEYFVVAVDLSMRDGWTDPRFFKAAAAVATRVNLEWGKTTTQALVLQRVTLR